jgi:arabinogalactan oligomer/maltooligosaccharide transport system substrate-binding protein
MNAFYRQTKPVFSFILTIAMVVMSACSPSSATNPQVESPSPTAQTETNQNTPTTVPTATTRPPENLTMWVYMGDSDLVALQNVLKQWEAKTGDTVEVVNYPYFEMLGKVEIAFPAGKGPDLLEFPHTNTGVWSQAGLIAPFPEGVLSESEKAQYPASTIEAFTTGGKLYGIPQIADTVVLMYNKALVSKVPQTMDELVTLAKSLTKGDIYGFLFLDNNMWFSWEFISGYGGYIFGQKDGTYDANDIGVFNKGAVDGMNYLLKFRNQDGLIPKDLDWNVLTGKFTEGKVAMMIMNANQASIYENAGVDVGMAVIPQLPNGEMPHPLLNLHGWAINAYSSKQRAAAELAVYLGANLSIPLYQSSIGNLPVRSDVLNDPIIANDPDASAAIKEVELGQPVPNIPEMGVVWTPVNNAFDLSARGEKTPAQALLEAAQAVKDGIAAQQ